MYQWNTMYSNREMQIMIINIQNIYIIALLFVLHIPFHCPLPQKSKLEKIFSMICTFHFLDIFTRNQTKMYYIKLADGYIENSYDSSIWSIINPQSHHIIVYILASQHKPVVGWQYTHIHSSIIQHYNKK